jgi:hypothetical protein
VLLGERFEFAVVVPYASAQRGNGLQRMGSNAALKTSGIPSTTFLWKLEVEHLGRRCPKDLTVPRTLD